MELKGAKCKFQTSYARLAFFKSTTYLPQEAAVS